MKKSTFILIAYLSLCLVTNAQNSNIKNQWNLKVGYASYPGVYFSNSGVKFTIGNYRIEANYGILDFLEVGGHLAYSRYASQFIVLGQGPLYKHLNVPYFGLNVNFHPLSFLIKKPDFWFDFYLLGRYGGCYYASPDDYVPEKGFYSQIRHGGGLAFYITKHFGLYAEGSFNNVDYDQWNIRGGLSFRF